MDSIHWDGCDQRQTITSVGQDVEKLEHLHTAGENVKVTLETSLVVPQKPKHRVTVRPSNSILSIYIPEGTEDGQPHKNLYMNVYSSIIRNSQMRNNPNVHQPMNG